MNPSAQPGAPRLSVIAIFYNMQREAPRTLYSLSARYQTGVDPGDYEVIAIDNGSPQPLDPQVVRDAGPNFTHLRIDKASPSPAAAINEGVRRSRGRDVGIMIDGARMASPGMIQMAMDCLDRFERPVVGTVGFHLGPDIQTKSPAMGYNQAVEDKLLQDLDWQKNGYRLFTKSALGGSSRTAWLGTIAESNLIFLPRALYDELGGFDERFDLPGGGLVNLDFYRRAVEAPGTTLLTLLGEATFHQIHGGTMANRPQEEVPREMARYREQYERIRGVPYETPARQPMLYGFPRRETIPWIKRASTRILGEDGTGLGKKAAAQIAAAKAAAPQPAAAQQVPTLKPGDEHYRAYVGRAENYDRMSAIQFGLLTMAGLRDHHRLLDLGCGSLRGGRLFMPYLQPGNYFGIEPNKWLIDNAVENEIGADAVARKKPTFAHNDDFNLGVFGTDFDFILAQSIFSHTGMTQLRTCMASVARVLKPTGLLIATFVERHEDQYQDEWVYPGLNHFSWQTITSVCAANGLQCRKIDWPHRLQTWFAVGRDPALFERIQANGVDFLPDDVILTGWRFLTGQKDNEISGFYRHRPQAAKSPDSGA